MDISFHKKFKCPTRPIVSQRRAACPGIRGRGVKVTEEGGLSFCYTDILLSGSVRGVLAGLQYHIHYLILHAFHNQDTGVGQNNVNTIDTIHISLLLWCWTAFCLQYSRNPS
jgi:hypothetical protein